MPTVTVCLSCNKCGTGSYKVSYAEAGSYKEAINCTRCGLHTMNVVVKTKPNGYDLVVTVPKQ